MGETEHRRRSQRLHVLTPEAAIRLRPPQLVRLELKPPAGRRDHGLRGLDPQLVADAYPRLEWLPPGGEDPSSPPIASCFWEFVHLDEEAYELLASFARRWGVLGICNHGWPCTHSTECLPLGVRI